MKAKLLLLVPALFLAACQSNTTESSENTVSQPLVSFEVVNHYTRLVVSLDGNKVDEWYSGNSGIVNRMIVKHTTLTLDVYDEYFEIKGTYNCEETTKSYKYIYSKEYSYALEAVY